MILPVSPPPQKKQSSPSLSTPGHAGAIRHLKLLDHLARLSIQSAAQTSLIVHATVPQFLIKGERARIVYDIVQRIDDMLQKKLNVAIWRCRPAKTLAHPASESEHYPGKLYCHYGLVVFTIVQSKPRIFAACSIARGSSCKPKQLS